jgi:glycosyltransferase involved in cell wall biosynthesis
MAASLPTVSALMAAYNYEQFVERAIQSALDQDYPPELLEVVVIDDGSTDSTADRVRALAERHPGRVRLIQQSNGGYVAATNRALAEGRGELLALLDADDMWLPGKTRRQVEMLAQRPELGMVFSDMVVVDANEKTIRPSLIWHFKEMPEQPFARVLYENVATQSAIMLRAQMREHIAPIPQEIPYADWWITLRCVQFSEIDFSREPLSLYRVHGSNLTADPTGAAGVREGRKGIAFQRWAMRNVSLTKVNAAEAAWIWANTEERARNIITQAGTTFVELLPPSSVDHGRAEELLSAADERGHADDPDGEARLVLEALAHDPWIADGRTRLDEIAARVAAVDDPLGDATGYIVIADAEDLLADDALLTAWGEAMGADAGVTLAIDASRLDATAAAARLQELVDRCGLLDRADLELVAVVGERSGAELSRMHARCRARLRPVGGDTDGLPVFTPATLSELRERAQVG